MTRQRYVTEFGMGTDVHGSDMTKAACRAVSDAIRHSSLNFFKALGRTPHDMEIDVLIGAPDPEAVDMSEVAKQLPYGTVRVEVTKGGLAISPDEGSDAIVIANAGVKVYLADA